MGDHSYLRANWIAAGLIVVAGFSSIQEVDKFPKKHHTHSEQVREFPFSNLVLVAGATTSGDYGII